MTPPRILVIDDQVDSLDVVRVSLFVTTDWTVLTCGLPGEAEATIGVHPVDAILLDLSAAQPDAAASVAALRVVAPKAPVIMLTATRLPPHETAAIGAIGLITKPFDPTELARDVRSLLGWPAP